jgi:hypothetical protein
MFFVLPAPKQLTRAKINQCQNQSIIESFNFEVATGQFPKPFFFCNRSTVLPFFCKFQGFDIFGKQWEALGSTNLHKGKHKVSLWACGSKSKMQGIRTPPWGGGRRRPLPPAPHRCPTAAARATAWHRRTAGRARQRRGGSPLLVPRGQELQGLPRAPHAWPLSPPSPMPARLPSC